MKNLLTLEDKDLIKTTYTKAAGAYKISDSFYNGWSSSKNDSLRKMFKDSLILSKEVEIAKDSYELNRLADDMMKFLYEKSSIPARMIVNYLTNQEIIDGVTDSEKIFTSTIKVPKGAKISKVIKHLVAPNIFDETMTKYSQLLGTKKQKGVLCLSVHPLDYMTMSVNKSDWESCLHLIRGGYKEGIISLLQSTNSIVAYLKSVDDFEILEGINWNNKKWRSIVTITDEFVHVNRHYPSQSNEIEEMVFTMIEEALDRPYVSGSIKRRNTAIELETNFFYNDVIHRETKLKLFTENLTETKVYIDGLYLCPCCGRVIGNRRDEDVSGKIKCKECRFSSVRVGSKVIIKSLAQMRAEFGSEHDVRFGWCDRMNSLCGTTFIVEDITPDEEVIGLGDSEWSISLDMVEMAPLETREDILREFIAPMSRVVVVCDSKDKAKEFFTALNEKEICWANSERCNSKTTKHDDRTAIGYWNSPHGVKYGSETEFTRGNEYVLVQWV